MQIQLLTNFSLLDKYWNVEGKCFLFRTITVRPDRDNIGELNSLIEDNPTFSKDIIKGIRFEIGTLGICHAAHNLGWAYLEEANDLRKPDPYAISPVNLAVPWARPTLKEMEDKKDTAIAEYIGWNEKVSHLKT